MVSADNETWRSEAYCQETRKIERIVRVKSAMLLRINTPVKTYEALVEFASGHTSRVIMSAKNLSIFRGDIPA